MAPITTITKKQIKEQLKSHDTSMRHSLGQNYLVSSRSINLFLSHLADTETIIEIGPGVGNITVGYLHKAKHIILIEYDFEKIPLLRENLIANNDGVYPEWVEIINEDFFKVNIPDLIKDILPYQIIGALPYNISKKIISSHLKILPHPLQSLFILQREVTDKYIVEEKNKSFLSISTSLFAKVRRFEILKKGDFYPTPKVDSRIISFSEFKGDTDEEIDKLVRFTTFIKHSFANPRKKITNTINLPIFSGETAKLRNLRPGEFSLENWILLYNRL